MLKKLREQESRKDNLVIYQVEEPNLDRGHERKEHDIRKIIKIFDYLQCPMTAEGIKFIIRVGEKKDDRIWRTTTRTRTAKIIRKKKRRKY